MDDEDDEEKEESSNEEEEMMDEEVDEDLGDESPRSSQLIHSCLLPCELCRQHLGPLS